MIARIAASLFKLGISLSLLREMRHGAMPPLLKILTVDDLHWRRGSVEIIE
jgi:hypothetical protein